MTEINLLDLYARIAIDTSDYERTIKETTKTSNKASDAIKRIAEQATTTKNKVKVLAEQYDKAKSNVSELTKAFNQSAKKSGYASKETQLLAQKLNAAEKEANELGNELQSYSRKAKKAGDSSESFGSKLKKGFSVFGKIAGGIAAAAGVAVGAVLSLDDATEEYRIAQGKLKTAYDAVGLGQKAATKAYTEFYKILGDTDTATEASQLLSRLTKNEKDITKWTRIAAGINGQWGDSLPIEALIESTNETVKVGKVTGNLADALNWAGISEENFNKQLEKCTSESERNKLVMETLSKAYDEASESFYRNNEELVKARENQVKLDNALSKLGTVVSKVKTAVGGEFLPVIAAMAEGVAGIFGGGNADVLEKGISDFIGKIASSAPKLLEVGMMIISVVGMAIINNLPYITETGLSLMISLILGITESLPSLVPTIVGVVLKIAEILTNPDTLVSIIMAAVEIILALSQGILDSVPILIEKAPIIIYNLLEAILRAAPQLLMAGAELLLQVATGIVNSWGKLIEVGGELVEQVKSGFSEKIEAAKTWGKDLIDNFIGGITAKWDELRSSAANTAQIVKDFLGFSEPKKGPLSNFHTYAPDMMELFTKGIRDNENMLTRQIESTFNLQPRIAAATAGGYKTSSGGGHTESTVEAIRAMEWKIVMQDGTLVGYLDNALGRRAVYSRRGN